jgi:hypothetical protein
MTPHTATGEMKIYGAAQLEAVWRSPLTGSDGSYQVIRGSHGWRDALDPA